MESERTAASEKGASDRRQRIIDAAARMFHENGYTATSVQDIARAVGLLKGSLYYHFRSKEELLYEVIKTTHDGGVEMLESWDRLDLSPPELMAAAVRDVVRYTTDHVVPVGVLIHDLRSLSAERRERIVSERDRFDRFLREVVQRGKDEGHFRQEARPELVAMALLGMTNWIYTWYRFGGPHSPEEIGERVADMLLNGLLGNGASEP